MRQLKALFVLSIVFVLFSQCQSDDDTTQQQSDRDFQENFGQTVSKDFIGRVVDINNNPIHNAAITIGTSTVQTDVNGVFIINGAEVHERFAHITAKKAGYVDGSRSLIPTSGKNSIKIMLLPNTSIATVASGSTSEVTLNADTKVTFDGAFQDANGNAYSGNVNVSMYHLKPSNENIEELMPGMLYAQTENGEEAVLKTYGMLNVELTGSGGQELQIASGHTAQITMQIDATQLATAPTTIPLWHFDKENGYWKQQGSATREGNKYVGNVSHFSWWNCDTFSSTVSLTVTVHDANGNSISNVGVSLIVNSTGFNSYELQTSSNGQVTGLIPAGEVLTINVYNFCGNLLYTSQIGPFSQDTILPIIVIPGNASVQPAKIKGSMLNCSNGTIDNGYVIMSYNNNVMFSALHQSNYDFTTYICTGNNQFTLEGYDFDNFQTTGELTCNFTFPETIINTLKACNSITEFISFTVNGVTTLMNSQINSQQFIGEITMANNGFTNQFTIYGNAPNNSNIYDYGVSIECASNAVGSYPRTSSGFRIIGYTESTGSYLFLNGLSGISAYSFKINKFGPVGDYMDVSFSGTRTNQLGVVQVVSGIAHVIRDN